MLFFFFAESASFTKGSKNHAVVVSPSETGKLNLTYTAQPTSTTAVIHAASSDFTIVKPVETDGSVNFATSDFVSNSLEYGIYEVDLTFPCCGGYSLKTAIVYALPVIVQGLVV